METIRCDKKVANLILFLIVSLVSVSLFFFINLYVKHNDETGRIVYIKYQFDQRSRVYIMDTSGNNGKILNTSLYMGQITWSRTPRWSPDGELIAFGCSAGPDSPQENICIMAADESRISSTEQILPLINWNKIPEQFCSEKNSDIGKSISWSPDNERLVFTCYENNLRLDLVCIVGKNIEINCWSAPRDYSIRGISWSPTSDKLALGYEYLSDKEVSDVIQIVGLNGKNPVYLTDGYSPEWSPDGSNIAFKKDNSIYTIKPDGSELEVVYQYVAIDDANIQNNAEWNKYWEEVLFVDGDQLSWSPNGKHLVFSAFKSTSDPLGTSGIYTLNLETGKVNLLTILGDGVFTSPDWSPLR